MPQTVEYKLIGFYLGRLQRQKKYEKNTIKTVQNVIMSVFSLGISSSLLDRSLYNYVIHLREGDR